MLPDDALEQLWGLFDASGIRPEYVIPVLWFESGFDPSRPNAAGAPAYGIAQTGGAHLEALGLTPAVFLSLSAADQLAVAVVPYFRQLAAYGIGSATRAYQANLLPATLPTVRGLGQIVALGGSSAYRSNAALDIFHHGAITLADLAVVMTKASAAAPSRAATARAYALRPAAAPPMPAVYGTDFAPAGPSLALAAVAGAALRGLAKQLH